MGPTFAGSPERAMKTVRLQIDDMHCQACVRRVERRLKSLPGVDLEEVGIGWASLRLDTETDLEEVTRALEGAGHAARVV